MEITIVCWVLYWDSGKESGNYYLGFLYWGFVARLAQSRCTAGLARTGPADPKALNAKPMTGVHAIVIIAIRTVIIVIIVVTVAKIV